MKIVIRAERVYNVPDDVAVMYKRFIRIATRLAFEGGPAPIVEMMRCAKIILQQEAEKVAKEGGFDTNIEYAIPDSELWEILKAKFSEFSR